MQRCCCFLLTAQHLLVFCGRAGVKLSLVICFLLNVSSRLVMAATTSRCGGFGQLHVCRCACLLHWGCKFWACSSPAKCWIPLSVAVHMRMAAPGQQALARLPALPASIPR